MDDVRQKQNLSRVIEALMLLDSKPQFTVRAINDRVNWLLDAINHIDSGAKRIVARTSSLSVLPEIKAPIETVVAA